MIMLEELKQSKQTASFWPFLIALDQERLKHGYTVKGFRSNSARLPCPITFLSLLKPTQAELCLSLTGLPELAN